MKMKPKWVWYHKRFAALAVLVTILTVSRAHQGAIDDALFSENMIRALSRQGVLPERVIGLDSKGMPLVCGKVVNEESGHRLTAQPTGSGLLAQSRGWLTNPSVIRDNGIDTFQLEVQVNGPVRGVALDDVSGCLVKHGRAPVKLRDDGRGGDLVADDFVFTSGPLRYSKECPFPPFYQFDPTSPTGVSTLPLGTIKVRELNGTITEFLLGPEIGLLRSDIPETPTVGLSPNIVVSRHLINIRSRAQATQQFIRFHSGVSLQDLTNQIYQVLPDAFDFFIFLSTNKIEGLPQLFLRNFVAGTHASVQVNFTGTGLEPYDTSTFYGSSGRLLGVNVLDTLSRGIQSQVATHELLHQWSAFISPSLGLSDGTHYYNKSSVGSLVGGFLWTDKGGGTFVRNCDEGANGAHHAPFLDKYLMGLIDGSSVAPLHAETGTGTVERTDINEPFTTVTIADIQSLHGIRSPGPADSQRAFSIAFVAESHERMLNSTEMTFYEILAKHYTQTVPLTSPDPYVGHNWVSISRFFGEGTTWRSDIPLAESTKSRSFTPFRLAR